MTTPDTDAPMTEGSVSADTGVRANEGQAVTAPDAAVGRAGRHPAERDRGRVLMRIAIAVAVFVAIGALAAYGFRWVNANERVRDARNEVESAARLLDFAEEQVVVVDEAVQAEVSSELTKQAADALALTGSVAAKLADAVAMIERGLPGLPDADVPLAEALLESAQARAAMMEEAPAILEAGVGAARAIVAADRALEELKAAETLSAQAAAEFNKHTQAGVRASSDASGKAEQRLGAARSALASATAEFPGADYSAFTAYIDAKVALIGISKEIDQLWLAGKIEESNKRLAAYNTRDAEVVSMAKALPESVRDPIADAYKAATEDAFTRYFSARENARAAGERATSLRDAAAVNNE